jgi:hypothetical protein
MEPLSAETLRLVLNGMIGIGWRTSAEVKRMFPDVRGVHVTLARLTRLGHLERRNEFGVLFWRKR